MIEHQFSQPNPMPHPDVRSERPQGRYLTIVLSVLFGALAGGLSSYGLLLTKGGQTLIESTTKTIKVEEESASVDVVKESSPAVVSIVATKDYSKIYGSAEDSPLNNFFGWPFSTQQPTGKQQVSSGSGFIVRKDGLIITNKHVINDEDAEYTVVMNDGKKYDAKVLAKDPANDIALVKIEGSDFPILPLGDSDAVKIGQTVIAIGNALGQYRNTVTKGVISGEARTITASDGAGKSETLENVFQTDASINPGNSGGPLIDLDGNVVAMNTAVDSEGQLIGFAIPVNVIKKDIEQVDKTGKIVQPYLGVRYISLTKALAEQNKLPTESGAWIQPSTSTTDIPVLKDGPADKAGLVANDIIVKLGDQAINEEHSLSSALIKYKPGDKVKLEIYHNGEKKEIEVTLGERPQS